jgi:hypothetical protein
MGKQKGGQQKGVNSEYRQLRAVYDRSGESALAILGTDPFKSYSDGYGYCHSDGYGHGDEHANAHSNCYRHPNRHACP